MIVGPGGHLADSAGSWQHTGEQALPFAFRGKRGCQSLQTLLSLAPLPCHQNEVLVLHEAKPLTGSWREATSVF